ncbi:hypothetical protein SFRURICE_015899 [Spodoptera frugiperda]|nr:hypothetical protein SFRURICE_015899 [Spodoptera frugiperda]
MRRIYFRLWFWSGDELPLLTVCRFALMEFPAVGREDDRTLIHSASSLDYMNALPTQASQFPSLCTFDTAVLSLSRAHSTICFTLPPGSHHCEDYSEDMVKHLVAVCSAWAAYRRALRKERRQPLTSVSDSSFGTYRRNWVTVSPIMRTKEEAGCDRERTSSRRSRRGRLRALEIV